MNGDRLTDSSALGCEVENCECARRDSRPLDLQDVSDRVVDVLNDGTGGIHDFAQLSEIVVEILETYAALCR
jgi:hypothetical protein